MAAAAPGPLAERNEIHKSCKTLESVVNVLNDYCEAANAIVSLQKKLAKALREAAAAKCVVDIPANALNASATIFESMAEVDIKFAKFADKECDGVSAEVKKWFKKLAKEERTHDEKIASANQKIKQAGQLYERKAKKNPRDAADEHTKYMNLLSTLGPEVNREKYNHALFVTQRHTTTMYNLAASFSRVADAEWMRSCESVRRFSPTVGQLGQWKALSEGGWQGSVPPDLPDGSVVDPSDTASQPPASVDHDVPPTSESARELAAPPYTSRDASEQGSTSRAVTPSGQPPAATLPPPQDPLPAPAVEDISPQPASATIPAPTPASASPPAPISTSDARGLQEPAREEEAKPPETLGRNTLAAFPAPPTHFPIPRVGGSRFNSVASPPPQEMRSESFLTEPNDTPFPRFTESPTPESVERTPNLTGDSLSPPSSRTDPLTPPASNGPLPDEGKAEPRPQRKRTLSRAEEPVSPAVDRVAIPSPNAPSSYRRGDYMEDAEFGVRKSTESPRQRAAEPSLGKIVERTDTGKSTGSVVAALRDRYARPGPSSPPPKSPPPRELPKVPGGVSSLANRYESSVSSRPLDSPQATRRPSTDGYGRIPEPSSTAGSSPSNSRYSGAPSGISADEIAMRRQRIEELEELELRERAHELRMKEREIELRTRELERERLQLLSSRGAVADGYISDSARSAGRGAPRLSMDVPSSRYPSSYSQSTTHLVPPPSQVSSRQTSSQPSSPAAEHAPYCGCEVCSASKYKVRDAPSPRDLRPPEPLIQLRPEKPKGGWIRRLSMPVINNAFSADTRKGVSSGGIAGGPGYRNSLAFAADEDGRLRADSLTGGARNRSTTNVARR